MVERQYLCRLTYSIAAFLKKHKRRKSSKSSGSTTSSSISSKELKRIIHKLELSRLRSLTRQNYLNIWRIFNNFILQLDRKPDNWEDRLLLFVGYLVKEEKQSQTIKSYISAVKAVLKENRIRLNEDKYILSALTRACKLENDIVLLRFLIHKQLLAVLLKGINRKFIGKKAGSQQPYLATLYNALFTTAYFGMFRVGELTKSQHTLKAKDVLIGQNKLKLLFTLHPSKTHGKGDKPQMIKISADYNDSSTKTSICPFQLISNYLAVGKASGQKMSHSSYSETGHRSFHSISGRY